MRVKICGIRTQTDLQLCLEAGVDAVGFVVDYPVPVPWNIEPTHARHLIAGVPPYTTAVLVTTGAVAKVVALAEQLRPAALQLHGDETVEDVRKIVNGLPAVRVVKALRISAEESEQSEGIVSEARAYAGCGIDGLLLDSRTETMPAGTGVPLNWDIARQVVVKVDVPVVLAGGINRENVKRATDAVKPYGVDLISAVETTPGVKDARKLKDFVEHFRQC